MPSTLVVRNPKPPARAYKEPADKSYRLIHKAADDQLDAVHALVLALSLKVLKTVDRDKLMAAIAQQDAVKATSAIDFSVAASLHGKLVGLLANCVRSAGSAYAPVLAAFLARRQPRTSAALPAVTTAPPGGTVEVLGGRLDLLNQASLRWIDERAGDLITSVTDEQRRQVQEILRQSFLGSYDVWRTAKLVEGVIGLDDVRASALANFANNVDPGVSRDRYEQLVATRANDLLVDRAETVARTETIAAANEGQASLWDEASSEGLLDKREVLKQWIVTPDDKLCENCEATGNSDPVGVDDEFDGGELDDVDTPPLHPRCRCAMGLVYADEV